MRTVVCQFLTLVSLFVFPGDSMQYSVYPKEVDSYQPINANYKTKRYNKNWFWLVSI